MSKQNKNIYSTKKVESEILIELKEKLTKLVNSSFTRISHKEVVDILIDLTIYTIWHSCVCLF